MFRKYHYLNTDLHQAAEQYVGVFNGEIVCHTGIIQMPMKKGKKRVHRLVVLPDYQGIGIGTRFIKAVAEMVAQRGFELNLTTTTPALVGALRKDADWTLARFGRVKQDFGEFEKKYGTLSKKNSHHLLEVKSNNRITYSFWYKPKGGL
jgi:GNAT superfamily N-acetyltransferase